MKYYNKFGRNGGRNYLLVIKPDGTALYIGWAETGRGPEVFSNDKRHLNSGDIPPDYTEFDSDMAANIILAAQHDLITAMPYREQAVFS